MLAMLQVGLESDMQHCLHPLGVTLAQDGAVLAAERAEVCLYVRGGVC